MDQHRYETVINNSVQLTQSNPMHISIGNESQTINIWNWIVT